MQWNIVFSRLALRQRMQAQLCAPHAAKPPRLLSSPYHASVKDKVDIERV